MSFVISVYVPGGIVMASDSRQSITIEAKTPDGKALPKIETVNSDFVYKTFFLEVQRVGINSFGESLLGNMTIESHIERFSDEILEKTDDVTTIPEKLVHFFKRDFPRADTSFHVAGYLRENRIGIPQVLIIIQFD